MINQPLMAYFLRVFSSVCRLRTLHFVFGFAGATAIRFNLVLYQATSLSFIAIDFANSQMKQKQQRQENRF